jgi:hypothetical protein
MFLLVDPLATLFGVPIALVFLLRDNTEELFWS